MSPIFSRHRILGFLAVSILVLSGLSVGVHYCHYVLGHENLYGLSRWFDLNEENNLPTWFQSSQLLLAGLLLWTITQHKIETKDLSYRKWRGLAALFFFMSFDEFASFHEMTNRPLRELLHLSGYFYFASVLIGAAIALAVLLTYFTFLIRLPFKTGFFFVIAALLYLSGTLGMEIVASHEYSRHMYDFRFALISDVEEILEMTGVFTFVFALLDYMKTRGPHRIELRLKTD